MDAFALKDQRQLAQAVEAARVYIDRDYLAGLGSSANAVLRQDRPSSGCIRILRLSKLVYNTQDVHHRLLSVLHTLSEICNACFLLICGRGTNTQLYLGLRADESAAMAEGALCASLRGSFPGSEFQQLSADACQGLLSTLEQENGTVAAVSQVPSARSGKGGKGAFPAQTIEHFIDAMKGETYTAMILAAPLSPQDAVARRHSLENLYSALSAMDRLSYQYGESLSQLEQHTLSSSITNSITDSVTAGYSWGTSQNTGTSHGTSINPSAHISALGIGYGFQQNSFQNTGTQQGGSQQTGQARQTARQSGAAQSTGQSFSQNRGMTLTQTNKTVAELLERIDEQLRRLRECEAYGLWECCAFFAAAAPDVALVAANIYKALSCGAGSSVEQSHLNMWDGRNPEGVKGMLRTLQCVKMPVIRLPRGPACSMGCVVSGNELPMLMHFPMRSVCGVNVAHMAAFGRDVYRTSEAESSNRRGIRIGRVFHMGRAEDTPVTLDVDSLAAHTLVTGSTGVGKSTLMEMLLSAMHRLDVKFMVVEPVKGEYKELLGKIPDLEIFTASPLKNRMLSINPFAFRREIHVLMHIDRLIEVFSVCWPLYAAQPALLRECIEEAYIQTGWDLSNSVYVRSGPEQYPDFRLLLRIVPKIIERSHFVGESKGTYEGALLTRIAMLTHGVFGQMFNGSAGLDDEDLFEKNVIIDLSDVGSQETVSLLMGLLVIRLREYRTGTGCADNQPLRHVMVLEEAHNIFQRNTQHNVEGGESVSGKSVRMVAQCIAEMRGYGQGVFIVDQSPGEVDLAAIRNTATKIVMRLPEAADQTAMAESLSLSQEQAAELSRLPKQVALVYQAGWLEPVMVRINDSKKTYRTASADVVDYEELKKVRGFWVKRLLAMEGQRRYDLPTLRQDAAGIQGFSAAKLRDFVQLFTAFDREYRGYRGQFGQTKTCIPFFAKLFTELLSCNDFFRLCPLPAPRPGAKKPFREDPGFQKDCAAWKKRAVRMLDCYVDLLEAGEKDALLRFLLLNDSAMRRQISVQNVLYGELPPR